MDQNQNQDITNYDDIFSFKYKDKCNMILKNQKTGIYEKFDDDGNIAYKLVVIKKEKPLYYFKLVEKQNMILYDDTVQKLYKYDLEDYYINNESNKVLFDSKKIVI